jgi:hypothetical protein
MIPAEDEISARCRSVYIRELVYKILRLNLQNRCCPNCITCTSSFPIITTHLCKEEFKHWFAPFKREMADYAWCYFTFSAVFSVCYEAFHEANWGIAMPQDRTCSFLCKIYCFCSSKYTTLIAVCYKPPSFRTSSNHPSRSSYCVYKSSECYLPPLHYLYPRCGHPAYNMMECSQTDRSVSWFKCAHISETDYVSIISFKVRLNSQSNCNFRPCRGV